jgi:Cdc6-like AAA superfamily ATPase
MEKLYYYLEHKQIPNLLFHGPSGSGKKTILQHFLKQLYPDKETLEQQVMYVNCAYGKGIKFIREELKFFAKTHINSNGGDTFKSIVLLNADKLTMDAQSALRRCIELFSHNTRFFIIVEDKYKLLKPILSRFCEIYIPEPVVNDKCVNLYQHILDKTFNLREQKHPRDDWLHKYLLKNKENMNVEKIMIHSTKLYEKGYSGLDLIEYINKKQELPLVKKYELLFTFHKIRKEFRNEKLLIMFILNFLFLSLEYNLENISFM